MKKRGLIILAPNHGISIGLSEEGIGKWIKKNIMIQAGNKFVKA